jgi:hypothetical protein
MPISKNEIHKFIQDTLSLIIEQSIPKKCGCTIPPNTKEYDDYCDSLSKRELVNYIMMRAHNKETLCKNCFEDNLLDPNSSLRKEIYQKVLNVFGYNITQMLVSKIHIDNNKPLFILSFDVDDENKQYDITDMTGESIMNLISLPAEFA